MQHFRTKITKREVQKKHRDGRISVLDRYVLHFKDPATGKRRMKYFERLKDAETAQNDLIKGVDTMRRRKDGKTPNLREAVEYWLESKKQVVSPNTHRAYSQVATDYIIGPAFRSTAIEKYNYALTNKLPEGARLVPMLGGDRKIEAITTAEIRMWYQRMLTVTTPYTAKVARKHLSSIFRLIEEDYEIRLARMPTRPGPAPRRKARKLLTEEQVRLVLEEAQRDKKWGAYYAFLFLTGARPSEMLGLLWEDVDLNAGRVRICRTQEPNSTKLKDVPKTDAGVREIPLNATLLTLLKEWQERCPRIKGKLYRVFPIQPNENQRGRSPEPDSDYGLTLSNFRMRVWYPMLERLGLPRISIYATRHLAISYLQAQGVEVGLVAKIAGHSSPRITLQYYTHAIRENDGIMDKLDQAYGVGNKTNVRETSVQT
jgi:integrase